MYFIMILEASVLPEPLSPDNRTLPITSFHTDKNMDLNDVGMQHKRQPKLINRHAVVMDQYSNRNIQQSVSANNKVEHEG